MDAKDGVADEEPGLQVSVLVFGRDDAVKGLAPCGLPNGLILHLYGPNFRERCEHCAELDECCGIKRAEGSGIDRGPIPLMALAFGLAVSCDKKSGIVLTGPLGSAIMVPGGSCNDCIAREDCSKFRRNIVPWWLTAIYDLTIGRILSWVWRKS